MILIKPSVEILEIMGLFPLKLIETAGRLCYKSKSSSGMADDPSVESFVKHLLKKGHESVIEHSAMTVKFICDRGVTHELVRHRLAAFSQESTRYCNYKGGVTFVIPPWVDFECMECDYLKVLSDMVDSSYSHDIWIVAMARAEGYYSYLLGEGWSPQQARSVLPNSLKTEIIVTANFREWRHILKLRASKAAHPQMREVMLMLLEKVKAIIPIIFDSIEVKR